MSLVDQIRLATRIGIDVGGTNTDAAMLRGREVVATVKTPTTTDVTGGITSALERVLEHGDGSGRQIEAVMLGTTHFANAVVERQRLNRTAVIRLCSPAAESLPPQTDWPVDLGEALGGYVHMVGGGYEFDGREIAPLDTAALRRIGRGLRSEGVRAAAVSCVFSPVSDDQERQAAEILREEHPQLSITLSSDIGRVGLLERENAAILNAALADLAGRLVDSFAEALSSLKVDSSFYFTQNDGTLMSSEFAARFPVLTFSSGPTNSMRGAAFLSGAEHAMVVDIGGTTTDVGMLVRGFPREAAATVKVGGVRTNFRMPDVYSVGLGGGSIVAADPLTVGPRSVGYQLNRSRVFGGDVLTATDIAVAAKRAWLGDPEAMAHAEAALIDGACARIDDAIADAIDRMKTTADDLPVVIVGGGSILAPDRIPGASSVIKPEHFEVANAIGAAIAQVGGEVDRLFSLEDLPREEALSQAKQEATGRAEQAGAAPDTINIVELDEVPLAYLPGNATRIRVKAVGDLEL